MEGSRPTIPLFPIKHVKLWNKQGILYENELVQEAKVCRVSLYRS